jgi:triosephosphate isomerase
MSIVGHSETRLSPENPHGDEDKDVNQKVHILISEGMETLLCIGEREREVENPDAYKPFLRSQILSCLDRIEEKDFDKIILAYEPVWAIGEKAARPATEKEIEETIDFVKLELSKNFRVKIFVLYGGSVDENNISRILSIRNVDGVLVGRASSDPKKWGLLLNSLDF